MLRSVQGSGGPTTAAYRRWAHHHPVLTGLGVFLILFLPLALHGLLTGHLEETLLPLPGALLFGGIWFALYRWGASPDGRDTTSAAPSRESTLEPAPELSEADRNLAQLCQLGVIVCPAVVPATLLLTCRNRPFVRFYAIQSLNLQLVLAFSMTALVATLIATDFHGAAINVVWAACLVVYGYTLAVSLMGAMKASHSVSWRYPINLPLYH